MEIFKHQNRHLLKKAVATVTAAVKEAPKKVEKATKAVAKEVKQAASSVEEFAASLEGVALDRAQTFYDEGIRSVADFANWTGTNVLIRGTTQFRAMPATLFISFSSISNQF